VPKREQKRRWPKRFLIILLVAIGIRFALMNLNHPLDLQTWQGLYVDLGNNRSPYDTLENLTADARATLGAGWSGTDAYMYYTYPPMLMMIHYPFAKLYALFYPPVPLNFSPVGVDPYPQVPLLLNFLFKLPIFLADIGIALLLYKMTKRSEKTVVAFLFNPLVILVSACWMFDSIAAFFLLLATYLFERKRYDLSAVSLAFGFLTKIFPIFALPIFCTEFIRQRSWKFVRYAFIFGLVSALVIAPFWSGVKLSFEYQAAREPSGLTPLNFTVVLQEAGVSQSTLDELKFAILPVIGTFLLVMGMSAIYAYLSKKEMSLRRKILITLVVYFMVSKNVHEPHILTLIPFFLLELHESSTLDKRIHYHVIWILPFIYAAVGVPLIRFLYGYIDPNVLRLFESQALPSGIVLAQGIVLGAVVIMFYAALSSLLITLIRGKPPVPIEALKRLRK